MAYSSGNHSTATCKGSLTSIMRGQTRFSPAGCLKTDNIRLWCAPSYMLPVEVRVSSRSYHLTMMHLMAGKDG